MGEFLSNTIFKLCLILPLVWASAVLAQDTTPAPGAAGSLGADSTWSCESGDRRVEREGDEKERLIEKWLCRRRRPVALLVGVTQRGVLAESGTFSDKLGFEAGLRLFSRADLGIGVGQVFKNDAHISLDAHGRYFLFDLPGTGGPYVGGGWRFKETRRGFFTFGFFGGGGLFFELQFRGSQKQPVAVVPAFGLRYAFP